VFSPNNDGLNDIFFISGNEKQITKIKRFMVFNRWGEALYEAIDFLPNDPSKGWDGCFKNETMNPGVFVYFAEVEYIDGWVETFKGDVTLIR
jgi:gliding motility-associated-like protein